LRGSYIRTAFPFLLVVPLSWIALRMSLRFAYSMVTLVSIAATAGTVAGFGPFQNHGLANPLQLVGVLVVLLAMNVLTIVALVSERADAQNASRVKSMFLANTSHELRTPLNAIIGFSSLIAIRAGKGATPQEVVEYAETITSSGEHLLALINDLLDMSRIEAGRFDMREETIAISEMIEDLFDLVRFQANAKSILLVSAGGRTVDISVRADRKALRQILLNLLSNAMKFTRAGGQVEMAVVIGASGELRLSVKDNGVGIPAEALRRVFQPFERAHQSGAADVEGTGLGLSIAQGLAVLHGGSIELDSTVGEGTVATLTLPANRVVGTQDVAAAVLKSTGQTQNQTIH
jgi:two-component system cell cycle sensor histidine kinase PleC